MMKWFATAAASNRCMAAACSSARIRPFLDTVIVLAVSICVVCLRVLAGMV